jgi:hypothetical protein
MAAANNVPREAQATQSFGTESGDDALFDFDFSQFDDFNYLNAVGQLHLAI